MHISLSLQVLLHALKDQEGWCSGHQSLQEKSRMARKLRFLTEKGKDLFGGEPDACDRDEEEHEDEDGALEVDADHVRVVTGEGLRAESVECCCCAQGDRPAGDCSEHRGKRRRRQFDGSQMSKRDQTGHLQRVLEDIGKHNGARVLEQDLELPNGQFPSCHKGSAAANRHTIAMTSLLLQPRIKVVTTAVV